MLTDADRLALLEERIRRIEHLSTVRPSRPRLPARLRTRRAMVVVGLALALLGVPAIALASHQFSDVPTNHLFHSDIAALATSGVTTGCGGGNYCPAGLVTRGEMAAFLNRLGALAPGTTPVVNAAELDGKAANELTRVAVGSAQTTIALGSVDAVTYGSVSITAPASGFVLVTAAPTAIDSIANPCTSGCFFTHNIRHVQTDSHSFQAQDGVGGANTHLGNAPVTWVFPVNAGSHTFESRLYRGTGNGTISGWFNTLTAIYSPFGATGQGMAAFEPVPPLSEPKAIPSE